MAEDIIVDEQLWIDLNKRLDYFEAPLPDFDDCKCAHRFNQDGICIRCNEDAEEWDAGCVEEIIRDLKTLSEKVQAVYAHMFNTNTIPKKMIEDLYVTAKSFGCLPD